MPDRYIMIHAWLRSDRQAGVLDHGGTDPGSPADGAGGPCGSGEPDAASWLSSEEAQEWVQCEVADLDAPDIVLMGPRGPAFLSFRANVHINLPDNGLTGSMEIAARHLLDRLQTDMTEWLTVPWPGDPASGRYAFAMPRAEIRDHVLTMGYEGRHDAVTPVISIDLQGYRSRPVAGPGGIL